MAMRIPAAKVPIELRRVAAQHLESLRGSGIGFNVDDLYLGDQVCPIYRPDVEGPAYYEFEVLKAIRAAPDDRTDLVPNVGKVNLIGPGGYAKVYTSPAFPGALLGDTLGRRVARPMQGFISVATGDHDHLVPHWSLEGLPMSRQLEEQAAAAGTPALQRIYKLDALSYSAEDAAGEVRAAIGQRPLQLERLPEKYEANAGRIVTRTQAVAENAPMVDQPRMRGLKTLVASGAKPVTLRLAAAADWGALKKDFRTRFQPMLRSLQTRAKAGAWAVHRQTQALGEGILVGSAHTVALLSAEFSLQVVGEGAEFVSVRVVKRPGNGAAVELRCAALPKAQELPFTLEIQYADEQRESLPFFVYSRELPSSHHSPKEQ
jgi:hypothetical protein